MSQPDRFALFNRPMPPGYRDELRTLLAERSPEEPRNTGSVLLFRLGELCLALPTSVASAVAPVLHITPIPNRGGTVLLGLVAFHGEIIPCCSLARILGLPELVSSAGRTLLLEETPGRLWAIPIDAVTGIRIASGRLSNAAVPLAAHWLSGSFDSDSGPFHLLDHDVLFRQITLATA